MYDGNNSWRINRMNNNYRIVTRIQADVKKRYQAEDISAAGRNQICQGKMLWEMGDGKDKRILSYSLNSFLAALMCADKKAFEEWEKKNESCLYQKGVGFLLERKLQADAKKAEDCFRGIVDEAEAEEAIARIWSVLLFPVWRTKEQSFFPLSSLEQVFQKANKQEQRKITKMLLRASNEIVYPDKKTEALSFVRKHMPVVYADILEIDDWQLRQLFPYEVLRDQLWLKTGKTGRKNLCSERSEIASMVLLNETLRCETKSPADGEQAFASRLNEWKVWLDGKKDDTEEYSKGITMYLHFLMALWNKVSDCNANMIKEQIKKLSMRTPDLKKRYVDGELSLRKHGMKQLIFFRNEIRPYGTLTLTMKNLERIGIPEYMPFELEQYDGPKTLWEQEQTADREIIRIWRITSIRIRRKEVLHTYQKELLNLASRSVFLYARKCGLFPDEVLPQALTYARKSKTCTLLPLLIGLSGRKEEKGDEGRMEHGAGSVISCG